MNNRKNENENGYALVIVLFAIVFIMITSAVFMRGSISHAKQEKIVDANNLAYMAAEMGVDYYKWSYINKYKSVKMGIWNKYYNEFLSAKEFINKNENQSNKDLAIKNLANEKRLKILKELKSNLKSSVISPANLADERYHFTSRGITFTENHAQYSITILGEIIGQYNGVEKTLEFNLSFTIPEFNLDPEQTGGSGTQESSGAKNLTWFSSKSLPFITKPNEKCPSGKKADLKNKVCISDDVEQIANSSNSVLYFDGNTSKNDKGNIGSESSKFYINGDIGEFNLKDVNKSEFYVKGNAKFHQFDNFNNSSLFTLGNFEVSQQADLSNSFIAIKGNLVVGQKFEIQKNSTIAIKGDLEKRSKANHKTEIKSNSKVCVGGNVYLDQITIDSTSKLYFVLRNDSNNFPQNDDRYIAIPESDYKNDPNTLFSNCAIGDNNSSTPGLDEPVWDSPEIEVGYY